MANTFGSEMSGGDLAPQLEASTAPNEEVAITGILEQIMTAGLLSYFSEKNFYTLIVGEGFRSVHSLRALKVCVRWGSIWETRRACSRR